MPHPPRSAQLPPRRPFGATTGGDVLDTTAGGLVTLLSFRQAPRYIQFVSIQVSRLSTSRRATTYVGHAAATR
jgi:hypothetical protein